MKHTKLSVMSVCVIAVAISGTIRVQAPVVASAPTGETADLSPRFEIGVPALYEHVLTMTQKQRVGRFAEATASLQMFTDLRLVATRRLRDGGAEVQLTFDRLAIEVAPAAALRAVYDSETDAPAPGDDAEPFRRALRRVAQTGIVYHVDRNGRATPVAGAREIVRLVEGLAGYELVATLFSPGWLSELVQDVYGPSHEKPERRFGESWEVEQALWLGGAPGARTVIRWTLECERDGVALIRGVGETSPPIAPDESLRGLEQQTEGLFSHFATDWDSRLGRTRLVEKSQALSLSYRFDEQAVATATLSGHSLLQAKGQ